MGILFPDALYVATASKVNEFGRHSATFFNMDAHFFGILVNVCSVASSCLWLRVSVASPSRYNSTGFPVGACSKTGGSTGYMIKWHLNGSTFQWQVDPHSSSILYIPACIFHQLHTLVASSSIPSRTVQWHSSVYPFHQLHILVASSMDEHSFGISANTCSCGISSGCTSHVQWHHGWMDDPVAFQAGFTLDKSGNLEKVLDISLLLKTGAWLSNRYL